MVRTSELEQVSTKNCGNGGQQTQTYRLNWPHTVHTMFPEAGPIHAVVFSTVAAAGARPRPPKGSLKEFVEKFKDRHYYVIEMRIVLVCCIAVFFKLFFSDVILEVDEDALTYSALAFVCCEW